MIMLRARQSSSLWKAFKETNRMISSTEMSAVVDSNSHTSRERLFQEKLGLLPRRDLSHVPAVKHGRRYEPIARDLIRERMGEDWDLKVPGVVISPDLPVCCSPDGIFYHREKDISVGLEIKCPFNPRNVPQKKEDIKVEYLIQAFVCMNVLCSDRYLLVFFDAESNTLTGYEMYPEENLWTSFFAREACQFRKELEDNTSGLSPTPHPREEKRRKKKWVREKLLSITVPFMFSL